ncbi:MAG TPA: ATPase, T2SS/T4P/T4SS family, partial [Roseimicrobium sp.]|nr:ATPase, T2SS/T4P/T4SS family [Roseimicrobium sp.]
MLADSGLATPAQYEEWSKAWRVTQDNGSTESMLGFISREAGIAEDILLHKLAEVLKWPFLDLPKIDVPNEVRQKLSTKVAFQYSVLPTAIENGRLQVAVSNPFDSSLLNSVQFDAGMPVQFALATKNEIEKALKKYYGVGAETLDEIAEDEPIDLVVDKEITEGDQEASVIKFVNQIIWEAYKDRATDIHFEPAEDELRIRYRVDGILHQAPMPPQLKRYQAALISRIKVMSGMNIAEKRLPQDGRINVRIKGEEIDIRVSTVPTVYGESVSLRLLTRGKIFFGLEKLGFPKEEEAAIREIIVKPHGIMLVTGPTGSGKSTSLYAFLSAINSVSKRIITIEEPVEYELKGINQIAVRSDIGLTFAVGLRHILRQDPNVIMVGEIRDLETAEMAIQASLTGHMVFSTLHTNDAPSAFTRMIDIGVEPFLVSSTVEGVMAQRLVRTICPDCKAEFEPDLDDLPLDFPLRNGGVKPSPEIAIQQGFVEMMGDGPGEGKLWKGVGCRACRQGGFRGRTGIHELMVNNDVIKDLIVQRVNSGVIRLEALRSGMITLRQDGWRKVLNGTTTVDEVAR